MARNSGSRAVRCSAPERRRPDGRPVFPAASGGSGSEDPRTDNEPGSLRAIAAIALCLLAPIASSPLAADGVAGKGDLEAAVASRADLLWDAARKVWEWAEPGYQETKSSALLASIVEEEGFEVTRGVAGIPTSFVASFGAGRPVIAILAEFDALPGLSQETVPTRSPREGPDWGHACGHHLFGAGSLGAALAVADGIRGGAIQGTLRLYGTPAEEGGGAKAFMARAGLFDDVDAVLHWHPGDGNSAGDPTNLARVAAKFRYRGRAAHAAASPEAGRSALDAVAILNYGAELLREHTPDRTRIHHVITAGGDAPNVVPAFAEAYYYVRHPDIDVARSIYDRLVLVAEGAAHATETELEIEFLGGIHNLLPNDTLSRVSLANFEALIDMGYTEAEKAWAAKLQESLLKPRPLASVSANSATTRAPRPSAPPTSATSPGSRRPPASAPPAGCPALRPTPGRPSPPAARRSAARAC